MATLTEELTHLHEPFSKRRSLYKDRAVYARLIAQRHGLLVQHKGADASWGWGACRPCKLKGRSFTECRSSGGLTLNHGPEKPDAGACGRQHCALAGQDLQRGQGRRYRALRPGARGAHCPRRRC